MAAAATFAFNHSTGVAVAHVTGATVGHQYRFSVYDPSSSSDTIPSAVAASFDMTVTGIGGFGPGEQTVAATVEDQTTVEIFATTVFSAIADNQFTFLATYTYDGANTVTISFFAELGVDYEIDTYGGGASFGTDTWTGTGATHVMTAVNGGTPFAGAFIAQMFTNGTYNDLSTRVFQQGVAGAGVLGNPNTQQGDVIVTLDGVDVTQFCVQGNWTRRLNRPSTAQIRCNMESVSAAVGSLLKIEALIGTTYEIVHHGRVLLCETDTAEDTGYTVYNSTDPMEMWQWRPVRDNDCDFSDPQIIQEYTTGAETIEAALNNSIDCGDHTQADCEGDLFLTVNAAASGGVDLTGAPTDWPMTIAELVSLFVSTGTVDVVITPTDPGGGIMGEVDFYNGDFGTDLSSTIVFSYGMGDYNVRRLRWNQDMTSMVNKLWYYGGPKIATAADPAAVQHWCFNVTGDDPGLAYPPGGALSPPASSTDNQLGVLRVASEAAYGVRMDIQIFDATDDNCTPGVPSFGRDLYRYRWQQESWLRAQPREIIHITPTRETEIGTFDIGDLVGVEAVSAVRGGFSGAQRVYEYTVSWDGDGVLELSELQTSADNEGL